MKKQMIDNKILKFCFLMLAVVMSSCSDYLDKTPDDASSKTMEDIFSNQLYTERFLLKTYSYLPPENNYNDNFAHSPWSGASDEMNLTWTYPMCKKMNSGSWDASMIEENCNIWTELYRGIRQCNLFLENVVNSPVDEATKNMWIGEVHFLRGLFHFFLLRNYGPIPIIDHSLKMDEKYYYVRNTFDQCIDFIVTEFQQCIDSNVPIAYTNTSGSIVTSKYGRVTKAAALAMKSRVLLYAASPLFNGNADYVNYKNEDGTLLFGAKDDGKWQLAANAALECITQVEQSGHYKLYHSKTDDPYNNYAEIFLPGNKWNEEILFARNKGTSFGNNIHQEQCMSPNGMGGWSGLSPTQEMVDAYEMSDGTTPIVGYNIDGSPIINSESKYCEEGVAEVAGKYHPAGISNMYANREPCFYATINFNGQQWRGRTLEFFYGGKDGMQNSSVDYSSTGYLLRKTSDEEVNIVAGTGGQIEIAIYARLAEIYLNYAEALNEAKGPIDEVYKYVNLIRNRSGLPNLRIGLSKEEMRERIHHERRIELAFEAGHRYFDCHRWKIAEIVDNGDIHGMNINAGLEHYFERTRISKRIFEKKHYLFPVPQAEINKRIGVVQSPLW